MTTSSTSADTRVASINIVRGFALICMVVIHFVIYFGNAKAVDTWLYFGLNHILADWGASGFLIMMGASQVLSAHKLAGPDGRLPFKRTLIRGVFIFLIGLLMLALAWGPANMWQWDILTLIGFATIILYFCRRLPSWCLLLLALMIAASTPLMRGGLDIASAWKSSMAPVAIISHYIPNLLFDPAGELPHAANVKSILLGFLLTGEFPVFPWLLFPLIGFVLGRRIVLRRIPKDLPFLFTAGVFFIALGLALAYAGSLRPEVSVIDGYIVPLSFYPNSFSMIFFQLGLSMTFIFFLYYRYDIRNTAQQKQGFWSGIFTRTSHSSLTFYFLHYLPIGWTLAIADLVWGGKHIYNLCGVIPAFLSGLVAVTVLYGLIEAWQRHGGKFTLEWCLYAMTKRL